MIRRLLLPFLLAFLCASTAYGQGRDAAGAEKLYDDGSKLLTAGDWPAACQKFEQSFALDAAPGTLLNLAACAEHDGKLALAWSRLKDARSLNADTDSVTRKKEIETFTAAAIARLEPRLPYLTVNIRGADKDVVVTRDGQPTAMGAELPIDPGKHVIEASAPGFKPKKQEVTLAEAARETITIELEPLPPEAPKPPDQTGPAKDPRLPPPDPPPSDGLGTMRIAGIIIGSVGVATIGASIATGVLALGKESDVEALECVELANGNLGCPATTAGQAEELSSSGGTLAVASTVTTFIGAGLVGGGVLLFILGGSDDPATEQSSALRFTPSAGPGGAALTIQGSF